MLSIECTSSRRAPARLVVAAALTMSIVTTGASRASLVETARAPVPSCGGLALRIAPASGGGASTGGALTVVGSFGAAIGGQSAASSYVLVSGAQPAAPFARDARVIFCDAFE